jgi:cyanophycinase
MLKSVACIAVVAGICCQIAAGQQPAASQRPLELTLESLLGNWESLDRHVAIGSLFQPVHGVRKREAVVCFHREGESLRGYARCADHREISHQERWTDGRTEFTKVSLADGQLTFEFPIGEWFASAGPIAVEDRRLENKGTIRVAARLTKGQIGPRLVGSWHMLLADGSEVFRGEWEAVRRGPLLLIGGGHQDLAENLRKEVFQLAGGTEARIVIIPTAIATAEEAESQDELKKPWLAVGARSVEILHTRDPKTADDPAFVKPLSEATAVFITNGHRDRVISAYRGTFVEQELKALHARGGLIAGTGTGAAVLGELVVTRMEDAQQAVAGLGLLPGFLLDDRTDREGFPEAIAANPGYVGLLIEPGSAALIRGPRLSVLGEGSVTVRLGPGPRQEAKATTYKGSDQLNLGDLRAEAVGRGREQP